MLRNKQLRRFIELFSRFDGDKDRPNVHKLAKEFGVSRRTIYRDLEIVAELRRKLVEKKNRNSSGA